jgi:putative sulfotransferase
MERFIVGTGRCGSTLLSKMLAENTSTLSIFEFFTGLDWSKRFDGGPVSGDEFAELISAEQPIINMVLGRGYRVEEVTYPFSERSRYRPGEPMPWILVSMLGRMSEDPDALFDDVVAFARALPKQELRKHYSQLFNWLTNRAGRCCWIERSGSSIDYIGSLHSLFPEAKFVHLHRDGRETALSMREHTPYRLAVTFLYDPQSVQNENIDQILDSRPPVELFGRYWSDQLEHGYAAVPRIDSSRYMEARFEDVLREPERVLRRIGEFLELEDEPPDWSERGAALVGRAPATRFDQLTIEEQQRLNEACASGMKLVGRNEG